MRVRGCSRPRRGSVEGTTKTLLLVILSGTKFQFYSLGVYCKPPRVRWPLCCARTHCLPHLRHSDVLCRRPPIPLPLPSSSPLQKPPF